MKYKYYLVLFAGFLILTGLYADNSDSQPVRIYDLNDWISFKNCNYPTSLAIGKDYVYFGTTGGIVAYGRYSGHFTEPYSVSDGLIDDNIKAVYYDKRTDYLWAAHKGGISYLSPTADQWVFLSAEDVMPSTNPVTRIGVFKEDIWAIAPGGFIFRTSRIPGKLSYLPDANISKMKIDWNISWKDPLPNLTGYFIHPNHYELIKDNVIIGQEMREFNLSLFYTDERQDIYGGAWGLGLLTGNDNIKSLTLHPYGPLNNSINAMAKLRNGFCLAGSETPHQNTRTGITFYYPDNIEWEYVEPRFVYNMPTESIRDIAYKDREIWYATDQGVVINKQKSGKYTKLTVQDGLQGDFINTIALEDSIAWAGSQFGLNKIFVASRMIEQFHLTPDKLHMKILKIELGPQNIWVGTDNGLYSINRQNHKIEHYDIFGDRIPLKRPLAASFSAIASSDSLIVAYGSNSFMKFRIETGEWTQLPSLPEIKIVYDLGIYDNYLWVGTNLGAFLINLDNNYREHYTRVDGLAGMHVYQVIVEDEDVWFGTNKGLTKYYWKKYVFEKN